MNLLEEVITLWWGTLLWWWVGTLWTHWYRHSWWSPAQRKQDGAGLVRQPKCGLKMWEWISKCYSTCNSVKAICTSRYPKCVRWLHSQTTMSSSCLDTSLQPLSDQFPNPSEWQHGEQINHRLPLTAHVHEYHYILHAIISHSLVVVSSQNTHREFVSLSLKPCTDDTI